jgi:hypothetical protein
VNRVFGNISCRNFFVIALIALFAFSSASFYSAKSSSVKSTLSSKFFSSEKDVADSDDELRNLDNDFLGSTFLVSDFTKSLKVSYFDLDKLYSKLETSFHRLPRSPPSL